MQLDPGLINALVPLGLLQTGALIYFAGQVASTLKDHGRRLDQHDDDCKQCKRVVAVVADREGIKL